MRGARVLRIRLLVVVAVAVAALSLGVYAADVAKRAELATVDLRFDVRGEREAPAGLAIVAIDDVTFSRLRTQWPFPRRLHARVIDRLRRAGARVIAYDVQFTEPTTARDDNALIESVARAGNVVLSTTEVDERGRSAVLGGDDVLRDIGARAGNGVLPADPGGVIRRVPFAVQGLETFAVVAAERAQRRQVDPADVGDGGAWIDFPGPPGTVRAHSFSDVLGGRVDPSAFRDKVVVVGASAASLQDTSATSTSGDRLMSGPEIQAAAAETIMRGVPLRAVPAIVDVLAILLLALLGPLSGLRLSPLRALAVSVAAALLYAAAAQLLFGAGWIVAVVYPLAALVAGAVGALAVQYATAAFERERVRDLFARFVPDAVVDEVLASADGGVRLGGVERDATVLFSDLRGFTSFAEGLDAERVIEVLNRYLDDMSGAILDHGGTLVAYMGDGIMAVFGAPLPQDDHADRALAAALEMVSERLPRFNAWMREQGLGDGFAMGIGLNSGPVMSGNVGSLRRLEYTAIGDTTNTAARLEGMTKGSGHQLFVAETTRARLRRGTDELEFVAEMPVRGRRSGVSVWSPRQPPSAVEPPLAGSSPEVTPHAP